MSTTQEQTELAVHDAILEALPSWVFLVEASQDEYDEMDTEHRPGSSILSIEEATK